MKRESEKQGIVTLLPVERKWKDGKMGTEVTREKWIHLSTFQTPPEEQEFCRFLLPGSWEYTTSTPKGKMFASREFPLDLLWEM